MSIEELKIEVEGLPPEYLAAGEGPAVVLMHGVGTSNFDWRGMMPVLARGLRVYAPNLPTVGGTAVPDRADHSPAFYACFVAAFMDALGMEDAAVVGVSLHGNSAARLALSEPGRVSALVLVDSTGLGRAVNSLTLPTVLPGYGETSINWAKTPVDAVQRAWGRSPPLFANPGRVPPGWISDQVRLAQMPGLLEAQLAATRTQFDPFGQRKVLLNELPGLEMPSLVVWGDSDRLFPVSQASDAVSRLRRGRLALISDCGHVPWLEWPDRFAAVLGEFLHEQAN